MNKQASNWLIVVAVLITIAAIAALAQAGNSQAQTTMPETSDAQAEAQEPSEAVAAELDIANDATDEAAAASTATNAAISVEMAWIRPTLGANRNTAAYVTLVNTSATPARLVGASVIGAAKAELHNSSMENGIMRMRQVDAIDIPAAGSVSLAPGGLHIMVFDLENGLEAGATASITLTIEGSDDLTLKAPVSLSAPTDNETSTGGEADMMDHSTMDHSTMDHSGH